MEMLKTPRTFLRRFMAEDLDSILEMESDPAVMIHTGPGRAQTREESKTRLSKILDHQPQSDLDGYFAVVEKTSKKLIAWFMLLPVNDTVFEIGFMINRSYWGKGYAFEVCHALTSGALTQKHINKIMAKVSPENLASINVLQKCNFVRAENGEKTMTYFLE
ncbi:MAG: hypothetical protein COW01_10560 [Bdellovibrionales bacterium CG12_big_fil_rev_8_21_14_0_65_38_15]|nr:MAG: hypothetical protein COW79_07405 [Bdellovibrionales bacterium CG22_combo_CG10-13_8_21_14_all_38_13]PIQ54578.1 MAG: hypothetical protein COW01_10560 [Bdellovibrionales bacterium CG12_big_fil_rev_8_21_14_0_65_38_15]PIR29959.1 MAG: hypothetical protein COV38_08405 [Bdellovibrionales bacterium CG11_big_fil_rev_8_21_14_0_20_38_13]